MKLNILYNLQLLAISFCKPIQPEGISEDQLKRELFISIINFYSIPVFIILNFLVFCVIPAYRLDALVLVLATKVLMTIIFFLFHKNYIRMSKLINSTLLWSIGPLMFLISNENLLVCTSLGFITPIYTLLLFQDQILSFMCFSIQFIFFNMLYIPAYKAKIAVLDFDDMNKYLDQQLELTNVVFSIISAISFLLFYIYKNNSSELLEAKMKSENALTLQEKFFFKFSHELKNPLNSLLGNLEMAYMENTDSRVRVLISNAKVCGELLLQLINNILDSGKMEVGNLEINYTPVRVTDILDKIWGISSEMIKNKGLYGQLTVHKKVPALLMLDSYRILQIMLNLVRNSVRFTNSGRILITVNWVEGTEITDSTFEPIPYDDDEGLFEKEEVIGTLARPLGGKDDSNAPFYVLDTKHKRVPDMMDPPSPQREHRKGILKIIVNDSGCGMDDNSVKGIFTLFPEVFLKNVQDNLPVKGLSMWITRQICEKMNGQIRLYSKPGRGSIFIVCIATETARVEVHQPSAQLEADADEIDIMRDRRPAETKMRAIVMDDNPYNTDVIRKYLEKSQVEVVACVKNGVEALNLYEKEFSEGRAIHIITMDLDMPLLDGKSACEKIRDYEAAHNLPLCSILIISGNCFEAEIKECLDPTGKIKANHFIRKPMYFLEFQRLMSSIQTHYAQNFRGPFHPKKVLIVDDDLFNLQFLGRLLNMDKYEYFEARNGREALDTYKRNWKDIGVIFMDCEMIVMDGYTATREIRKLQTKNNLPKVKIYGVTGHTGLEHEMKCQEAGMNKTVSKPFRSENIKKIVAECLSEYNP